MRKLVLGGLVAWSLVALGGAEDGFCEGENAKMSCCELGSGTLLPVFPGEYLWNRELRACLYLLGLLWCFLGVSVLSDVFMSGIETITQTTVTKMIPKKDEKGNEIRDQDGHPILITEEQLVWNPAVANLSLMALGSSTPEILLSIIEIGTGSFIAEDLGPATIVGSAAFNLYVITAFCMVALPDGEGRKIEGVHSFLLTASCSLICYLWLYIIVLVSTPDVVTIAEGIVTLLMMPVLIYLVWLADNGYFKRESVHPEIKEGVDGEGISTPSPAGNGVTTGHNAPPAGQGATSGRRNSVITAAERNANFFKHRQQARAFFMGGGSRNDGEDEETKLARELANAEKFHSVFQFGSMQYAFMETIGSGVVKVLRQGQTNSAATVKIVTSDGTAKAGKAYGQKEEIMEFAAGETEKDCPIQIIHDDEWNQDLDFYVELQTVEKSTKLGRMAKTCCTIIDMDSPGVFSWLSEEPQYFLSSDSRALLVLERRKGCKGVVSIRVKSEDANGKAGEHFLPIDQALEWK